VPVLFLQYSELQQFLSKFHLEAHLDALLALGVAVPAHLLDVSSGRATRYDCLLRYVADAM
jgi:hypothetical protein